MAELPLEIWSKALSCLSAADLVPCATVCSNWSALVQMQLVEDIKYVESPLNYHALENLIQWLKRWPDLARRTHTIAAATSAANIIHLIRAFPKDNFIKTLTLDMRCLGNDMNKKCIDVYPAYESLCRLESLEITDAQMQTPSLLGFFASTPSLRHLVLRSMSPTPISAPPHFTDQLHHLTRVELENVENLTIQSIIKASAKHLVAIDMHDCTIDSAFLEHLPPLPKLREIHTEEDCNAFIAATPRVYSISITENHWPLDYIQAYPSTCKYIASVHIKDTPYSDFDDVRTEMQTIFQLKLLPRLQYLQVGTWRTLKSILPLLPSTVCRIDLHELDFSTCPSTLLAISNSLSFAPQSPIAVYIHGDDDCKQYATTWTSLQALQLADWLTARVYWNQELLWEWGSTTAGASRKSESTVMVT